MTVAWALCATRARVASACEQFGSPCIVLVLGLSLTAAAPDQAALFDDDVSV